MRVRGDFLILTGAVLLTALIALATPQQEQPSTYSSYDTGRNGYRAFYEILRREGVRAARFEGQLGALHRFDGTMIVSENGGGRVVMAATDIRSLASIVRGGARLIVAGPMLDAARALRLPGTIAIRDASQARAIGNGFTNDVTTVAGTFSSAYLPRSDVRTVLVAGRRAVAIEYALGRGTVIAVAAPDVFSNAMLARYRNAWFGWNVVAGSDSVLFDERLHGYVREASIWSVMPQSARDAIWICIAILLLAVVGNAFRSAPPIMLAPKRPRDSSAYITAVASLLHRARAGESAIERFAQDGARLARGRPSLATLPEIRERLERLERMTLPSHPTDASVLAAAQQYLSLRRELAS